VDTTLDHLPEAVCRTVRAGAEFADLGDRSAEFARLLGLPVQPDGGVLSLRGLHVDGHLATVVALYEPKKFFGSRTSERFAPAIALFDLAFARFADREARGEAVRTLEDVTQRVHGEYVRKLAVMERQLLAMAADRRASDALAATGSSAAAQAAEVTTERQHAELREEARRAQQRAGQLEQQFTAAAGQLEQAHVELHRRSEALRQRTRTLYLIDRVLALDAETTDPHELADGLLALVGDDMQAQRCSLVLRSPVPGELYLAAARGIAPHVTQGARIVVGEGVAGRVAKSRQPVLVQDVDEAGAHPLLGDQYFTSGSFISFPLVYHDELVGVVNLTNRAQRGVFGDEDVERVRLLALVISLIAWQARLPERLLDAMHAD
jgi:putative methionine-R-sulfoxide reductase with GAF domain